ncbi:hypothetical protein Hanom_Chr02g00170301 [Helianthus anomalus]
MNRVFMILVPYIIKPEENFNKQRQNKQGKLSPDAVRFQQVVSSNTAHVKGQNFVFSRVAFAIQKGVATQLVARLPAISL